ncbi:Geraniol dehydrogenase 1 [Tripterygium wilfordii]|uniref:mannitol dehydrogenase n=1 Tax=Tripterygium wilfordii TaxID=458696 RepID=A0A7J7DLU5_TRIWF|nr:Geraniol dehydrogenase 1 [Tripterygium wilfordii]
MAISPEKEHPREAFGWAARDKSGLLSPFKFSRRATGEKDVTFKVLYCGICHSDLHMIKNEWGSSIYPLVPGHEVVGVVTEVGSKVEKFKTGDKVGVGCMVGSCRSCSNCNENLESYCPKIIPTYTNKYYNGTTTYGGYSDFMVADEHFVVRIPDNLPLNAGLLKYHGKLVMVGVPEEPLELPVFPLLMGRKMLGGSMIGGMKETQEMIDFAAKHKITPDIEVIPIDYVNAAMERLLKADVKYRFVIDIANTLKLTA